MTKTTPKQDRTAEPLQLLTPEEIKHVAGGLMAPGYPPPPWANHSRGPLPPIEV
jgi:hypothetical protein